MDYVVGTFEPTGMPVSLKVSLFCLILCSTDPSSALVVPFQYIAYGKLAEVMPFLGRRAIENKSLMSGDAGAAAERRRITGELWRRCFG